MLDYQTHFSYSQSDQRDNWDNKKWTNRRMENKNQEHSKWKTNRNQAVYICIMYLYIRLRVV